MSFENPTPLRLGMAGTFAGKRYRIVGRVVMGMDDGGETYYWNEFNLGSDDGDFITLVHEPTEDGEVWRLFTMFEPDNPMSVQAATGIRVGDKVNLEGNPVRVTLVDESQVYHIEGEAPEGVEVGDVAHYFNAETANKMQVVSWTGQEVECYRGVNLRPETVSSAFNIRNEPRQESSSSGNFSGLSVGQFGGTADSASRWVIKVVVSLLILVIVVVFVSSRRSTWQRAAVVKSRAPSSPLAVGSVGSLDGETFHIRGHAVVEVAQVGRDYERHEYLLLGTNGNPALLVYGLKPGGQDWCLFTPLSPLNALTPQRAATLRSGEIVNVDGVIAPVTELFQSTVRAAEFVSIASPTFKTGDVAYGFAGNANGIQLLALWNETSIAFHRGRILPAKAVTAAFSRTARR